MCPEYCTGSELYIFYPTSPYISFNFQQLFFYDIFLRNAYFTSLRVIGCQSIVYNHSWLK